MSQFSELVSHPRSSGLINSHTGMRVDANLALLPPHVHPNFLPSSKVTQKLQSCLIYQSLCDLETGHRILFSVRILDTFSSSERSHKFHPLTMLPKYLLFVKLGTCTSSVRITEHTGVDRKFKICYSTLLFLQLKNQRLREDKGCSYRHKIKYLQNQTPHHLLQVQSFFYPSVNLTMPGSANCLPAQLLFCTAPAIFLASLHPFPLESKCLNARFLNTSYLNTSKL